MCAEQFQSSPDRGRGRDSMRIVSRTGPRVCFSPLQIEEGVATQARLLDCYGRSLGFQSSPDRGRGRDDLTLELVSFKTRMFQSSPDRGRGRDNIVAIRDTQGQEFQSSPDRGRGRDSGRGSRGILLICRLRVSVLSRSRKGSRPTPKIWTQMRGLATPVLITPPSGCPKKIRQA